MDKDFLADAGWDAHARVLSARPEHPTLGWPVCQVGDCDAQASTIGGICPSCRKAMAAAGSDAPPATSGRSFTSGIGLCAAGCARPWESRRRPLCSAHEHQREAKGLTVETFLARTDLCPLPGFGPCQVLACTRLRHARTTVFCLAHQTRWRHLDEPRPDQAACGAAPNREWHRPAR